MGGCPSCGAAIEAGMRFCASCGASLTSSCRECGAEIPEGARFCPSCGTPVGEAAAGDRPEERKVVTVLFADVTESTTLGERLDPERLRSVLATYFEAMREEIAAEGGTIEKFIGDAVMAVFGVPAAHEDDPARALRAARRMLRRLVEVNERLDATYGVELRIRVGVNTGEVIAAVDPEPGEPIVTGDAVNTAARLQSAAEVDGVMVGERTARAVRGFRFGEVRGLDLKGKADPVPALALLGETAVPERGVPGLFAPMVGRDRELDVLRSLYERVEAEARPHLVTIYGEPGVGKSRLTREFLAWVKERAPSATVLQGRCLPYGDGVTYWPLAEILKSYAGITDNDPPDDVLRKVRNQCDLVSLGTGTLSPGRACAALAYTIGVEDPDAPMGDREPRQVRQEMLAAWRGFFTSLAADRTLVVVIEDIHWADPALLDLLDDVAERAVGGIVFLCPARPTLLDRRPTWGGGRRNVSGIDLDPLSDEDADRLVSLLLAIDDLPRATHDLVLSRAEGNPFFLEEIVRQLIDQEQIVFADGRWRAAESIAEVEIPDTIQGVLAARIDLLEPRHKRTLQLAAVVGRNFWPAPVGLLLNGDRDRLEEILERLEERDLVRSRVASSVAGEPEYTFKHVLTRDVAYESLPRRDRSHAHATVAEWIDAAAPDRSEFIELLAYHLTTAHEAASEDAQSDPERSAALRARAFEATLAAAEDARRRFAIEKATALLDRALDLAETPLERARTLERRGETALNNYQGDLAFASFREAAWIRREHVPADRAAIALACARAVESPTRWPGSMARLPAEDEVEGLIRDGMTFAGDGDSVERVRLLMARGFTPFAWASTRGTDDDEISASAAAGREAAAMADRLGRPDLASAALDSATSASLIMGRYREDLDLIDRRIELLDLVDDPWEAGDVLAMAAWTHACLGDLERSLAYAHEGRVRASDSGAEGIVIHLCAWQAYSDFWLGEWDRVLDDALAPAEALLGDRASDPPYFTQNLYGTGALIASARGRGDLRRRLLPLLEGMAVRHEGRAAAIGASAWRAWIAAREGAHDDAARFIETAEQVPTRGHWSVMVPVAAVVLAEAGRWSEVPAFLERHRGWSETPHLRGLPPALDRLEGQAALAAGDAPAAIELLRAAADAYDGMSARWEHACTQLFLAEALARGGRQEEGRETLTRCKTVFDALGSTLEIARARELGATLGIPTD